MTWIPHRKVATASTVGPVVVALLAWITPDLPAPVVAVAASLVTAGVAYWTPSPIATSVAVPVQGEAPHA
jgi:hypothetical protein